MVAARCAALAALAAGLLACSDAAAPVSLEDFGPLAMDAVCEWAVACAHVPDDATCRRQLDIRDFDTRRARDAVASGRLRYDADAGGECLREQRASHCTTPLLGADACRRLFEGFAPPGAPCASRFECAGESTCAEKSCEGQCCRGTCAPREVPALAEPGERCESHFDCVPRAHCETDGRCVPVPLVEGERCLFGCGRGDLYCDLNTLTCARYSALGTPCGEDRPCDAAYAFCDGVCRLQPDVGEACGGDRRCVPRAVCRAGRCEALGEPKDACTEDGDCWQSCSDSGECEDYRPCELEPAAAALSAVPPSLARRSRSSWAGTSS